MVRSRFRNDRLPALAHIALLISALGVSRPASADVDGTGQYSIGDAVTPMQVGTSAPGTLTISGCQCTPNQSVSRADVLVGTADGGEGLLTMVNDFPGFGEVALRVSELLRIGAASFNSDDFGFGRMVVGADTVVIGADSGGSRFDPNEWLEVGGPESHPAELEVRGRVVAFDLISIGDYGHGRLDVLGTDVMFSPNGLLIGNRGRGVVNVTERAVATPTDVEFASVGSGGEINVFGNGAVLETFQFLNLQGSGDGAELNIMNGGRLWVRAPQFIPDQAVINGIGGGVFSPARINLIYDDFTTDPPLIESVRMTLRHTKVRASGPGAMIDLTGSFTTVSNGHTPTTLLVEDGAALHCADFLLMGTNATDDPDLFTIDGAGSTLSITGELGITIGNSVEAVVRATNGGSIEASTVRIFDPPNSFSDTTGLLELTGGSSLLAESVDVAMTDQSAFLSGGTFRVCDGSVATISSEVNVGTDGTLQGNGTIVAGGGVINNGGTVFAGCSPGALNIQGDFGQPDGKLVLGVGAGEPSRLVATGSVNIAGEIEVELRDGLPLDSELLLELVEADSDVIIDPATTVTTSGLEGLMTAEVSLHSSGVAVSIAPTPGRADVNGDGTTDLTDHLLLTGLCFDGPGQPSDGACDLDLDNDVDLREVQIMQLSFGDVSN